MPNSPTSYKYFRKSLMRHASSLRKLVPPMTSSASRKTSKRSTTDASSKRKKS